MRIISPEEKKGIILSSFQTLGSKFCPKGSSYESSKILVVDLK
jgi:hypothetical protein